MGEHLVLHALGLLRTAEIKKAPAGNQGLLIDAGIKKAPVR